MANDTKFPTPFGGIEYSVVVTSLEAIDILKFLVDEQDDGHFHNFAVELDHPEGVAIWGSKMHLELP
jgi:hypothetical protein